MNNAVAADITIQASIQTVWEVITKPEHIAKWFADTAAFEPQAGSAGALSWEGLGEAPIEVVTVDQPHAFAFTWVAPDEETAGTDDKTLITFSLAEVADGTQVRVVESGFNGLSLSDADKITLSGKHASGWPHFLGKLRDYAEGSAAKA